MIFFLQDGQTVVSVFICPIRKTIRLYFLWLEVQNFEFLLLLFLTFVTHDCILNKSVKDFIVTDFPPRMLWEIIDYLEFTFHQ